MDFTEEGNAIHFVGKCDTFRNVAFIMGNLYAKEISNKVMAAKDLMQWIAVEMSMILNQITALKRPDYFNNIRSTSRLFNLFKSKGLLSDKEEMDKLQLAMILIEKIYRLEQLLKNGCSFNYTEPTSMMHLPIGLSLPGELQQVGFGLDYHFSKDYLNVVINYMNDRFHLLSPASPASSLVRKITCPNWTDDHEIVYLDSKTNIFRCMVDCLRQYYKHFNFAHIGRSGLFYSRNGNVITESGLSSAVLKNEEKKQCITAIFM